MLQQRILLVEGQDDRELLQKMICTLDLRNIEILPKTPKDFCESESDGVDVLRTQALPFAFSNATSLAKKTCHVIRQCL